MPVLSWTPSPSCLVGSAQPGRGIAAHRPASARLHEPHHDESAYDDLSRKTDDWATTETGRVHELQREYRDLQLEVADTDALGHATTHTQDALGREVQVRYADGKSATSGYDALNRRYSVDRKGYRTEWDYDAARRVIAQRDVQGSDGEPGYAQSTAYTDATGLATVHDRRGIDTVTAHDGLGRVESVTRAERVEKTEYDAEGEVTATVDGDGHRTEYGYDGARRRTSQTVGAGTSLDKYSLTIDTASLSLRRRLHSES